MAGTHSKHTVTKSKGNKIVIPREIIKILEEEAEKSRIKKSSFTPMDDAIIFEGVSRGVSFTAIAKIIKKHRVRVSARAKELKV